MDRVCSMLDRNGVRWVGVLFFFQAEDGIRDLVRSRGLGDVYKRQTMEGPTMFCQETTFTATNSRKNRGAGPRSRMLPKLSLIHI